MLKYSLCLDIPMVKMRPFFSILLANYVVSYQVLEWRNKHSNLCERPFVDKLQVTYFCTVKLWCFSMWASFCCFIKVKCFLYFVSILSFVTFIFKNNIAKTNCRKILSLLGAFINIVNAFIGYIRLNRRWFLSFFWLKEGYFRWSF